jgi:rubrerythrin
MNDPSASTIDTVPEFLVHAVELEHESAENYRLLAESMTVHHNAETADLFRRLADMSDAHASEAIARAEGVLLPEIAPWDFKWNCPGTPEGGCLDEVELSYLMTPQQALQVALHQEIRGRDFYAHVASSSPSHLVRAIAGEMAEEESEHVELIKEWIAREDLVAGETPTDLDPPNIPD